MLSSPDPEKGLAQSNKTQRQLIRKHPNRRSIHQRLIQPIQFVEILLVHVITHVLFSTSHWPNPSKPNTRKLKWPVTETQASRPQIYPSTVKVAPYLSVKILVVHVITHHHASLLDSLLAHVSKNDTFLPPISLTSAYINSRQKPKSQFPQKSLSNFFRKVVWLREIKDFPFIYLLREFEIG